MRRAACDQIETKLRARGIEVQRVFDGGKGYILKTGTVTIATKTAAEKLLRKKRAS